MDRLGEVLIGQAYVFAGEQFAVAELGGEAVQFGIELIRGGFGGEQLLHRGEGFRGSASSVGEDADLYLLHPCLHAHDFCGHEDE